MKHPELSGLLTQFGTTFMKGDGGRRAGSAHVEFNEKNDGGKKAGSAHVTGNLHHDGLANHAGLRIFAAEIISKPLRTIWMECCGRWQTD